MATASLGKTSRLDLRMNDDQKRQIEQAARIRGVSLSQWSLGTLLATAREEILAAHTVALATESFEAFVSLLDEPQDPTFADFVQGRTIWDE